MANEIKKIGLIAGNKLLPLLIAQSIKKNFKNCSLTVICFKNETNRKILQYADRVFWVSAGKLTALSNAVAASGINEWIMAGQVNPLKIFNRRFWDGEFEKVVSQITDLCPHSILLAIIEYLEGYGAKFMDSTFYLKDTLAYEGNISGVEIDTQVRTDIEFGVSLAKKYVELDVGQTVIVKNKTAVALECVEGTDIAIKRAYRFAGKECIVIKFCKQMHDFRFDVPVVGMKTLYLLKKTKASALILPANRVIILEKEKFIQYAKKWEIPVIGIS